MTKEARKTSGIILLTVPSVIYGGFFLLNILSGNHDDMQLTEFQKGMFRAGHAHAGVLIILALVAQLLADHAALTGLWRHIARSAIPFSAILISGGFFAAASGENLTRPNNLIVILYIGVVLLVAGVLTLGIGLLRNKNKDE